MSAFFTSLLLRDKHRIQIPFGVIAAGGGEVYQRHLLADEFDDRFAVWLRARKARVRGERLPTLQRSRQPLPRQRLYHIFSENQKT